MKKKVIIDGTEYEYGAKDKIELTGVAIPRFLHEIRKHEREKIKEACDVRKELNYKELSEAYKTGWASAIEKVMKECGKRK